MGNDIVHEFRMCNPRLFSITFIKFLILFSFGSNFLGCSEKSSTATESSELKEPIKKGARVAYDSPVPFLLLPQLGIDPFAYENFSHSGLSLIDQIRNVADAFGGGVESISLEDYLKDPDKTGPVIFESDSGKTYPTLSTVKSDGQKYLQVIGRSFEPILVPLEKLNDLEIKFVWLAKPQKGHLRTISTEVGNSVLGINKLWHNFGLIEPYSSVSCDFHISNDGNSPFTLEFISSSCGCTTAEFPSGKIIYPGESQQIVARISRSTKANSKQKITIRVIDKSTQIFRDLTFVLFSNQFPVMSISPREVDFGSLRNEDSPATRSVIFSQTMHDPFRVIRVNSNDLPISAKIQPVKLGVLPLENSDYKLSLTLDPAEIETGLHQDKILITTTSRYTPELELPVQYFIRPHVEAVPSVAAFGSVSVGAARKERISLVSVDGLPFLANVISSSVDCEAEIETKNGTVILIIKPQFLKKGGYLRHITVRVSSKAWEEEIKLRCVAYVK